MILGSVVFYDRRCSVLAPGGKAWLLTRSTGFQPLRRILLRLGPFLDGGPTGACRSSAPCRAWKRRGPLFKQCVSRAKYRSWSD
jgi:hypothetical protein